MPKDQGKGSNDYVAWLRYVQGNEGRPTRIVICDSDAPGAFKVYRSITANDVMKNPYISGCPACRTVPVRDWNDSRAPVVADHLGIGWVVVCNYCGVLYVITHEAMKEEGKGTT